MYVVYLGSRPSLGWWNGVRDKFIAVSASCGMVPETVDPNV